MTIFCICEGSNNCYRDYTKPVEDALLDYNGENSEIYDLSHEIF